MNGMGRISEILNQISNTPDCFVYPPNGFPIISPNHLLPNDLREFYMQSGGVLLFGSSSYPMVIVPPDEFLLANPLIFQKSAEELETPKVDISWSWYIVGKEESLLQYISVDLAPERLGRCYDSFWDCHASPGNSRIIAATFTDLLTGLLHNKVNYWYWLQTDFVPIGDAYQV